MRWAERALLLQGREGRTSSEHRRVKLASMHSNAVSDCATWVGALLGAPWKSVCHAFNLHYLDGVRVRKERGKEGGSWFERRRSSLLPFCRFKTEWWKMVPSERERVNTRIPMPIILVKTARRSLARIEKHCMKVQAGVHPIYCKSSPEPLATLLHAD